VAEVLAAARVDLTGALIVAGLSDEEAAMTGSARFGEHRQAADWAIVGEPTGLSLCTAHLGQFAWKIRTHGESVHSSRPELGVNAIDQMARVLDVLRVHRAEIATRQPHELCGPGTLSPGVIQGGDITSTVPDWCELTVDRRLPPGAVAEDAIADVERLLDGLAATDPTFVYSMSGPYGTNEPLDTDPGIPLVEALRAGAAVLGLDDAPAAFPGATDAPNIGVPAVICGPGSLAQAHTVDEWVSIDQLVAATKLYLWTTLALVG
jgi:acetylornithine deacetylase/succinyl-diaminopimelate desuccinylase-like protein